MAPWLTQRLGMMMACLVGGLTLAIVSGDETAGWYIGIGIVLLGCVAFPIFMRFRRPPNP